jgi:hypothetical protein
MPKKNKHTSRTLLPVAAPEISPPRGMSHKNALHLQVTQEQIKRATPKNSSHCMIAESLKQTFEWARKVTVDLQTIRFTDSRNHLRYEYLTPRPAQEALVDFDWGTTVEPFSITLRTPRITQASIPKKTKMSPERLEAVRKNLRKAQLARKTKSEQKTGVASGVIGGKPSPIGPLATGAGAGKQANKRASYGVRREFGIRGLIRNKPSAKEKDPA